jgi:hypothetical protein
MGRVTARLTAWSEEPANAQTINGMQGGQEFFSWLNQPTNPLLNDIVLSNGIDEPKIRNDLKTIMDAAERNPVIVDGKPQASAHGIRHAYEADPVGFMAAVKSNNQAELDQRIQRERDFVGPRADRHAELEAAEQQVSTVIEDPEHNKAQQLNGALLLEGLQSVMAGDMKLEDLFQTFVDFIGTILGTKFDGIAQQLTQTVDRLGLKPEEQAPAPAPNRDPSAQPNANQPATQPTTEPVMTGPGM